VSCTSQQIVDLALTPEKFLELKNNNKISSIEVVTDLQEMEAYQLNAFYRLSDQRILKFSKRLDPRLVDSANLVQKAYSDYQEKSLSRLGLKKMYIG
jgi:nitrogen fixation/metabolism regulation signal transduction histidine kinase